MNARRALLAVAVLDVLFFGAWIGREEYVRRTGLEVKLPIEGYDPRDLLRGHYVRFRLTAEREAEGFRADRGEERFCLVERKGLWHVDPATHARNCRVTLRGKTANGRVSFGIDRFYVDERRTDEVLRLPPGEDTYLVAHLDADGGIHPKELVVAGKAFSEKSR